MSDNVEVDRKQTKKAPLGRGLGSLLSGANSDLDSANAQKTSGSSPAPQVSEFSRIWKISIDKLRPHPRQPRRTFNPGPLEELSKSIQTQGILQPIVARRKGPDIFEIIAGERRWRAAQMAGLHEVPVIIQDSGDQKSLELALIENIQREDLNPLEEAFAYSHLIETYHLTQQQLAERLGKDRVTIANMLRLLQLGTDVRQMVGSGELSMGQAKVLLQVSEPLAQKKLALRVVREKLSVRACEKLVAKHLAEAAAGLDPEQKPEIKLSVTALREELQKIVGSKVTVDYLMGKGRVSIHFYSDDELSELTDKMRRSWQQKQNL